jgi:hypothetical protein
MMRRLRGLRAAARWWELVAEILFRVQLLQFAELVVVLGGEVGSTTARSCGRGRDRVRILSLNISPTRVTPVQVIDDRCVTLLTRRRVAAIVG